MVHGLLYRALRSGWQLWMLINLDLERRIHIQGHIWGKQGQNVCLSRMRETQSFHTSFITVKVAEALNNLEMYGDEFSP